MKIYDISQELFGCCVFPGDPAPEKERVLSIADGDACNLTKLSMCAHNGTHLDAPFHFYKDGKTVDQLDLSKVIGEAKVVSFDGDLTEQDIDRICGDAPKRLLLKGSSGDPGGSQGHEPPWNLSGGRRIPDRRAGGFSP